MAVRRGTATPSKVFRGTVPVKKVMRGTVEVWSAKPTVTIESPNAGKKSVAVVVTNGRYQLQSLTVKCGETTLSTQSVNNSGSYTIDLSQATSKCALAATVTDEAYYTSDAPSVNYNPR